MIKNSNIFPDYFITKCKQCPNEPQNISSDVKNNMKRMAIEKNYMHRLSCFWRKDLKFDAADKNKNKSKFKFLCQSGRSRLWFDLDLDWIDMNFSTHEPISIRKSFKVMAMSKTQIHSKHFKFQSEMQKL